MKKLHLALLIFSLPILLFTNCQNELEGEGRTQTSTYKVAIIMPGSEQTQWSRTAEWALENINKAQMGLEKKVKLSIEWVNEDNPEWINRVNELAKDKSCAAIIGPYHSDNAMRAAQSVVSARTNRLLILPISNSTEFQRIYGKRENIWFLCQSNLTECEILLTEAALYGSKQIDLIACDSDFGKDFNDWFSYLALELGLEVGQIHSYSNSEQLREAIREEFCTESQQKSLLFAPGHIDEVLEFDACITELRTGNQIKCNPDLFCADVVYSTALTGKLENEIYKGVSPTANPESGFLTAYENRFGSEPTMGEPHLYDALLLTAYALSFNGSSKDLHLALRQVVESEAGEQKSWLTVDTHNSFALLSKGVKTDVDGVTGEWIFDKKNTSTVLHSTYSYWVFSDGKFHTMGYLSTEGGNHSSSTLQAWEWQTSKLQEFSQHQQDYEYPRLEERWAVVVATSDTWSNYRHQADALAMYRLLLRHGYDDEHIVFICEDNIAYDPNNIYPGCVKVEPDGENLYAPAPKVDYKLSEVNIAKLKKIMSGEQSGSLPEVIHSSANDNVIVFWCGHGGQGKLSWGSDIVGGNDIRDILDSMWENNKYRKMMFVIDACYSGSIGEACIGVPGALFITAATSKEPSKADMYDHSSGVWLSNSFTRAFQDAIDAEPSLSLHELYEILARRTTGSHARIYNIENYGNMYYNSLSEFLSE